MHLQTPKLGLIVVKWYSAILGLEFDILEIIVDLPTLGRPTSPTSARSFNSTFKNLTSPGSPFSLKLGAGRLNKESIVDYTVRIKLHKNILDQVKKGDILATLYVNDLNLNLTKEDLDIFKIRNN